MKHLERVIAEPAAWLLFTLAVGVLGAILYLALGRVPL
ncbi:PLDc N-terminal domain-containing protein [Mesorhizobium yinganensis]